jgi:hypothetical protein
VHMSWKIKYFSLGTDQGFAVGGFIGGVEMVFTGGKVCREESEIVKR